MSARLNYKPESTRARSPVDEILASPSGSMVTSQDLHYMVQAFWSEGGHYSTVAASRLPTVEEFDAIPWEKVDCMLTKMVHSMDDGLTFALDMFPPASVTKAAMHVHPLGDRVIAILRGHGHGFIVDADGVVQQKRIGPGDVITFPRNTGHCFWGGDDEPVIALVVLNPYVPLNHPLHTICPKKSRRLAKNAELQAVCDAGDLNAIAAKVMELVEKGEIELDPREYMEWGEDIVAASEKRAESFTSVPSFEDWTCRI